MTTTTTPATKHKVLAEMLTPYQVIMADMELQKIKEATNLPTQHLDEVLNEIYKAKQLGKWVQEDS